MIRENLLRRAKRLIQMGIYEDDDKWIVTLSRIAADIETDEQPCRRHAKGSEPPFGSHSRSLTAGS